MSNILELLAIESSEMATAFIKASIEGQGTPQEVADRRESAVKKFLEKYFPFPFRIAKGNINDSYGKRSASIDCIVLNPEHPYTVSDDERYSLILADGVDFAIEVKPDLTKETEITRSLKQIESVKKLKRVGSGIIFERKLSEIEKEYVRQIPSFIFADKTYKNLKTLVQKIVEFYEANNTVKYNQFDCIVINGYGLLINSREFSRFHMKGLPEGIIFIQHDDKTLAGFLLWLNRLPLCTPRMTNSVLEHYLDVPGNMSTFEDLNRRLLAINEAKV